LILLNILFRYVYFQIETLPIPHSAATAKVEILIDPVPIDGNYGIRYFNFFINLCHPSCATCSGPEYDKCLTCPTGANKYIDPVDPNLTSCKCDID
jgi:hypothetical protein